MYYRKFNQKGDLGGTEVLFDVAFPPIAEPPIAGPLVAEPPTAFGPEAAPPVEVHLFVHMR